MVDTLWVGRREIIGLGSTVSVKTENTIIVSVSDEDGLLVPFKFYSVVISVV